MLARMCIRASVLVPLPVSVCCPPAPVPVGVPIPMPMPTSLSVLFVMRSAFRLACRVCHVLCPSLLSFCPLARPCRYQYSDTNVYSSETKPLPVSQAEFELSDEMLGPYAMTGAPTGQKLSVIYSTIINNYIPNIGDLAPYFDDRAGLVAFLLAPSGSEAALGRPISRIQLCQQLTQTWLDATQAWKKEQNQRLMACEQGLPFPTGASATTPPGSATKPGHTDKAFCLQEYTRYLYPCPHPCPVLPNHVPACLMLDRGTWTLSSDRRARGTQQSLQTAGVPTAPAA